MFTYTKYFGIALTIAGIFLLIATHAQPGSELPLITGLFLVFFTKEKMEDERAKELRSNALMISFATGYIFEVSTTYLYSKGIISFHLQQLRDFIILVLALSIVIFYVKTFFITSKTT